MLELTVVLDLVCVALIKTDVFLTCYPTPRISSSLDCEWVLKGQFENHCTIQESHVCATNDLKNPVLFSLDDVSPQDLSLYSSTGLLMNRDMGL